MSAMLCSAMLLTADNMFIICTEQHQDQACQHLYSVATLVASWLVDQVPCHDGGVISIPVYTHTHTLTHGRSFCAAMTGFQIAVGISEHKAFSNPAGLAYVGICLRQLGACAYAQTGCCLEE